jgi:hypothetical protein
MRFAYLGPDLESYPQSSLFLFLCNEDIKYCFSRKKTPTYGPFSPLAFVMIHRPLGTCCLPPSRNSLVLSATPQSQKRRSARRRPMLITCPYHHYIKIYACNPGPWCRGSCFGEMRWGSKMLRSALFCVCSAQSQPSH